MILRVAIALVTIFMATQAQAACKQTDLRGYWRFIFDIGYLPTGATRTHRLSCLLRIDGNGFITSRGCDAVDGSGSVGEFIIHTNRRLRMKVNTCKAVLAGTIVYGNDFDLRVGNYFHAFNGTDLTISESKEMMLGWLAVNEAPKITVTAIRRATP